MSIGSPWVRSASGRGGQDGPSQRAVSIVAEVAPCEKPMTPSTGDLLSIAAN